MARRGPSVQQTSHRLMCDALRGILRDAVDPGGGDRIPLGSIPCRAVASLYMLLLNHPVDRRGRCRSCRRPGAVLGRRWRRCRVHGEAALWLNQPTDFVDSQLARELGVVGDAHAHEAMQAPDLDDTEVLPRITSDPEDAASTPQSPAVSSPPFLPRWISQGGAAGPGSRRGRGAPRRPLVSPWPIRRSGR